jgi:MFS family permease
MNDGDTGAGCTMPRFQTVAILSTSAVSPDDAAPAPPPATGLRRLGAALTYRDFRVMWSGALTSTVGTWMQQVAQNWLVLTLAASASAFFLGLDAFLGQLPILLFTLIGGVFADRRDRRQMLLMSQYIQMTSAFVLAALVYWNQVQMWHVLVLSFVTGLAQAFGGPAYQSLLPELVDKKDLPNAIALNSIQFNLSRVLGPLFAGGALAVFGMAACFGLNGLSFLAVIAALLSLHVSHTAVASTQRIHQQLKSGLVYVRERPALMSLAVLGFSTTFLGSPILTFLPVFARSVFNGDVNIYTQLMACAGAGAVAGALVVAWMGRFPHMGRTLLLFQLAYAIFIVAFAHTRVLLLNDIILFAAGASMMMVGSLLSSLVQLNAPNEMRGRVMSIYMVSFRGGMPLGSLVAGLVANRTSAPFDLTINAVLLSLVSAYFLLKSHGVREL